MLRTQQTLHHSWRSQWIFFAASLFIISIQSQETLNFISQYRGKDATGSRHCRSALITPSLMSIIVWNTWMLTHLSTSVGRTASRHLCFRQHVRLLLLRTFRSAVHCRAQCCPPQSGVGINRVSLRTAWRMRMTLYNGSNDKDEESIYWES